MTEIREGTIELQLKVNGKIYALGVDLSTCPTEERLTNELKWLIQSLVETLKRLGWFLKEAEEQSLERRDADLQLEGSGD